MSSCVICGKISMPIRRMFILAAGGAAFLTVPGALLQGLALVVQLLAASQRDLDFRAAAFVEIELERYDGHALALDRAGELIDLALAQQQLARPLRRVVVEGAGLPVFRDIGVYQPDFAAASVGIGLGYRRLALAQRLDLAAGKHDSSLEGVADLVIEAGPSVVGDHLDLALDFTGHQDSERLSAP